MKNKLITFQCFNSVFYRRMGRKEIAKSSGFIFSKGVSDAHCGDGIFLDGFDDRILRNFLQR